MRFPLKLTRFWWLHPVAAVVMALVPFLISGHFLTGPDYYELWHTEKYLDNSTALVCGSIVISFVAGALVQTFLRKKKPEVVANINYSRLFSFFLASMFATTIGYIVWGLVCVTHGIGITQVISVLRGDVGAVYAIRDLGATIPGITTATQFGMATAIFGALLWNRRPSKTVGFLLVILVFMAMFRALLWSERLATIEIVVPCAIALFGRRKSNFFPRLSWLIALAPLVACGGLYLYFTISESVRSWGYYSQGGGSLWYFSWMRLCGYYITALNNGALMQKVLGVLPFPYNTLEAFWKFPGISAVLPYYDLFSIDPNAYLDSLKSMANPEFNNPSGIFPYIVDFGPGGACVFWFVAGWVCTSIYSSFVRGTIPGLLFFPLLYVSFLEISRIPYLTSSRTLPSWLMLFCAYLFIRKSNHWSAKAAGKGKLRKGNLQPRRRLATEQT